jgi:fluoroquinolone transport system permease protein
MRRYGIARASLAVVLLWVMAFHFLEPQGVMFLLPLALFIDGTMMSLLLTGATMVFEKQENALQSFLVLPIRKEEYLLSKSLAVVTLSLVTLLLLLPYATGFKGLNANVPGLVAAVTVIAYVFARLGIIMTYYARDFTDLVMSMFKFSIVLTVPTILEFLRVFNATWIRTLQYLNPTKNALVLLQAATVPVARRDVVIAALYLLVLGAVAHTATNRLFDRYAMKGGGA